MNPKSRKLKILCLHGWKTNGRILMDQMRITKFINLLEEYADLQPVNGPYEALTSAKDVVSFWPNMKYYTWWYFNENEMRYDGLSESLDRLAHILALDGPFDGIVGFSQGGMMASILAILRQREDFRFAHQFKFVVTIASVMAHDVEVREAAEGIRPISPFDLPSFHFCGVRDPMLKIVIEAWEYLYPAAPNIIFDGKHTLPYLRDDEAAMFSAWLREQHHSCLRSDSPSLSKL
eukprot:Platyproteum_vivax@DN4447_c0_g1_i1.p1